MINKKTKNELIISNDILSNINGYSLDKHQRLAIVSSSKYSLVVAGAGSGKSLTIIGKIRYLIELKGIKPSEILCITFTNDAAKSLETNINKDYNYGIRVYTFHKLALEILKYNKYRISNSNLLNYIVDEYFYMIEYNESIKFKVKKILCMIDAPYKNILLSKELCNLKRLIITFINLFKTNNYDISYFLKIKTNKDLIRIIIDIYMLYDEELRSENSVDFDDMILYAHKYVESNKIKNYKYIIIDEYQDTSYIRFLLVKSLVEKSNCNLMCVGDDYQSIYRFNGCNINIFLNFKKYFKGAKEYKIINTYRNSQELINVAGRFITKNKNQLYKKLKSKKHINKPIKIMYGNNLKRLLDMVLRDHKNILILGRNNFDINSYFTLTLDGYITYKDFKIKYSTIHASKGLEEECVIIINLKDDILGIPNKIKNDSILRYVNNNKDLYPYEEERRLFYVALTRSKSDVYLLVDKKNPSIFVKELIKDSGKYIEYI